MCDRLSPKHGYLCDACFDELVHLGPTTDLDDFMGNPPHRVEVSITASRNYFSQIFEERA
jgi:hypothetical protein